ncbi:hypothetical protein BJ165DRAFT_1501555 [Panaeolus papilionaceus]|nr:hypothetical protein BJ165DRAFT_1501555 [Panaeolus papilionaceus]
MLSSSPSMTTAMRAIAPLPKRILRKALKLENSKMEHAAGSSSPALEIRMTSLKLDKDRESSPVAPSTPTKNLGRYFTRSTALPPPPHPAPCTPQRPAKRSRKSTTPPGAPSRRPPGSGIDAVLALPGPAVNIAATFTQMLRDFQSGKKRKREEDD